MTVAELIAELQGLPGDLEVLIDAGELMSVETIERTELAVVIECDPV